MNLNIGVLKKLIFTFVIIDFSFVIICFHSAGMDFLTRDVSDIKFCLYTRCNEQFTGIF